MQTGLVQRFQVCTTYLLGEHVHRCHRCLLSVFLRGCQSGCTVIRSSRCLRQDPWGLNPLLSSGLDWEPSTSALSTVNRVERLRASWLTLCLPHPPSPNLRDSPCASQFYHTTARVVQCLRHSSESRTCSGMLVHDGQQVAIVLSTELVLSGRVAVSLPFHLPGLLEGHHFQCSILLSVYTAHLPCLRCRAVHMSHRNECLLLHPSGLYVPR